MTAPTVDFALAYAKRGWPVLPLAPGQKYPLGALAPNGLDNASLDPQQIREWWGRCPTAGVGIRTGGATRLCVIDVDSADAWRHLKQLAADAGQELPVCPEVRTGKGLHLYLSGGLPSSVGRIPGVDVRAERAYVAAPPSTHPSGATYAWAPGRTPRVEMPPVPGWLAAALQPPPRPPAPARPVIIRDSKQDRYFASALNGLASDVRIAAEGTRHSVVLRSAMRAGQLVGQGLGSADEVEAALVAAAVEAGIRGGEREARSAVRWGLARGAGRSAGTSQTNTCHEVQQSQCDGLAAGL